MKISYNDISTKCNQLQAISEDMSDILESIEAEVKKLDKYWSGNAFNYYQKKMKKLSKNFTDFKTEIDNSIVYMTNVASGFQAIDNTLVKKVFNLKDNS